MCEQVRLSMKMHAYVREVRECVCCVRASLGRRVAQKMLYGTTRYKKYAGARVCALSRDWICSFVQVCDVHSRLCGEGGRDGG